jgi:hypothetical protein
MIDSAQNSTYDPNDMLASRNFTNGTQQVGLKVTYNNNDEVSLLQRYSDTGFNTLVGQTQIGYDAGVTNSITHKNAAGSTLESFSYTLDAGYRLTSETDNINGTPTTTNCASSSFTTDCAYTIGIGLILRKGRTRFFKSEGAVEGHGKTPDPRDAPQDSIVRLFDMES